jgi:hypothetical protein
MSFTPSSITPVIVALCEELVPGSRPFFMPVKPVVGALANMCFVNVAAQIDELGGEIRHGWKIGEIPGVMIEAVFHGVWRDPSGRLRDITPIDEPTGRILFLPDPVRRFDGQMRDSVRRPLSHHPAVGRMISAQQKQFQLWSAKSHEVPLSPEEAAMMDALEMEESISLAEALGPAGFDQYARRMGWADAAGGGRTGSRVGRNDPCPCGSGKKFKKCCGRPG